MSALLKIIASPEQERETAIAHYGRMFNALAIVEVASNTFTWRVKDCTRETEAMFRG